MTIDKTLDKINGFVPQKWQWVLLHAGFRKQLKNMGWMFFGQMFSLLVSFFIGVWLARYLGAENYGVLNYSLAFAGMFAFLANFGVDGILSRELLLYPENRNKLMGTAFRIKLLGGFLTFFLVSIAILILEKTLLLRSLVILYSFTFIFQALSSVISIFFQTEVKAKRNVSAMVISTVLCSILKVVIILCHQGVFYLMAVFVLEVVIQGLVLIYGYRKDNFKIKDWGFDYSLARRMLASSWLLMLSSAATYIYLKIDQVMLGSLLGKSAVGVYSVAVKFSEIWYFVPGIICGSLFPAIINAKKAGAEVYAARLRRLYLLLGGLAFLIALFFTLSAHWIINLLFGAPYVAAAGILQIYVWSNIGMFVGTAILQYLLSENKLVTIFYFNFWPMLLNVVLNLILIPRFGLAGAAWATLVSYSAGPLFMYFVKIKTD